MKPPSKGHPAHEEGPGKGCPRPEPRCHLLGSRSGAGPWANAGVASQWAVALAPEL